MMVLCHPSAESEILERLSDFVFHLFFTPVGCTMCTVNFVIFSCFSVPRTLTEPGVNVIRFRYYQVLNFLKMTRVSCGALFRTRETQVELSGLINLVSEENFLKVNPESYCRIDFCAFACISVSDA